MDTEIDELRSALARYRYLLRGTIDEQAIAALSSLIEEANARLRALERDEEGPAYRG